jgi:hypothetical protein
MKSAILLISICVLTAMARAQQTFTPSPQINPDNYTNLMAVDAEAAPGLAPFQPGGHGKFFLQGWERADQSVKWDRDVALPGTYCVNVLLNADGSDAMAMELTTGKQKATVSVAASPRGWVRLAMEPPVVLAKGPVQFELKARLLAAGGKLALRVMSVELVRPAVRDRLHHAALRLRSDTAWMRRAGYGFMFTWTSQTYPRQGKPVPYDQAVQNFDVEKFADSVAEAGAGFVVMATSHAEQYFPAPLKSLDGILPGRTSSRDLVADLAAALEKRHIRLMLYFHLGAISDPHWLAASHFWDTDTSAFFDNWTSIISEVGQRYGKRLTGWWFDDGATNYYYRSPDWEKLTRAAKAGNADRVVGYNPWVLPSPTEFQDFYCGEGMTGPQDGGRLAESGAGRFLNGPNAGLQACSTLVTEGDWLHGAQDSEIAPPRWTARELAVLLRRFADVGRVPMFNLEIYQDGSMSAETIRRFREAKALRSR